LHLRDVAKGGAADSVEIEDVVGVGERQRYLRVYDHLHAIDNLKKKEKG